MNTEISAFTQTSSDVTIFVAIYNLSLTSVSAKGAATKFRNPSIELANMFFYNLFKLLVVLDIGVIYSLQKYNGDDSKSSGEIKRG